MLEPRRLAARSAADYMARQRDEHSGDTIGYHVRLDRKVSRSTRIEIITEGILVQRLLSDPELNDTGVVIFDEFHERSLTADTALAITLEIQQVLRPDLRIVIMSATLQPDAIANHIGNADIHTAENNTLPSRNIPALTAIYRTDIHPSRFSCYAGDQQRSRQHSGFHARRTGNSRVLP